MESLPGESSWRVFLESLPGESSWFERLLHLGSYCIWAFSGVFIKFVPFKERFSEDSGGPKRKIGRFSGFFKILFPFSPFYTPIFSEKREQKSKNASETPNAQFFQAEKQELKGPEGYKNPRKVKLRP